MGFNLADLVRGHAISRPQAPCVTYDAGTLTYADLDERSNRVASGLLGRGLQPGDRVAIVGRNSPVFYELLFACAKAGLVLVPVNWRLSAREVQEVLEDAAPRLVFAGSEQAPLVTGAAVPATNVLDLDTVYSAWRDAYSTLDPCHAGADDDTLALLYTSGTTGRAKGVRISHRNLSFTARMAREIWDFSAASVNLVAMPLFHIGGIGYGMMGLSQGGHTVLLQQPVPAQVLDAIQRYGVTHAFLVPTVIHALVSHPGVDDMRLGTLARIFYGAAPINEPLLLRAMQVFGCGFSHAYGMTETAGTVVTLLPQEHDPGGPHAARLRSCGKPVPWVELDVVDPLTARRVPAGEIGEIWIRSEMVTRGYWNKPEETAAAIDPDGWLHTGDAATMDEDGFVYIRDRYKDMVVSGGENVFPAEVENVLSQHPAIAEVAVIGVPHERWGETVKAIVVLRPGQVLKGPALIAFARERLAHYKCPTSVALVDSLPKSASGKILKKELRGMDWSGVTGS